MGNPSLKKVCIHEASHIVFSCLNQKLNINYPLPTYCLIKGEDSGETDSGIVTMTGTSQLNQLTTCVHIIADLYHILAGYASQEVFLLEHGEIDFNNVIRSDGRTDFSKAEQISKKYTNSSEVIVKSGGHYFSKENAELLNSAWTDVKEILNLEKVKSEVNRIANVLEEQKEMEGDSFDSMVSEANENLNDIDISEYVGKYCSK